MLTLTLTTTTNLGPMLEQLAVRARLVAGETPPTDTELAEVHDHVAKQLDVTRAAQAKALKTQLGDALPKGIRLKKVDSARDGLTLTSMTTLELDDVSLVPEVVLAAAEGQPPLKPFAGFTVKQDKTQVTLTGRAPTMPEGAGRLALTLEPSSPPLSHNAASVAGGALAWAGNGFDVKVVFAR
ncbi:MAG: hypothetical protein ABTQ32_27435 [Myxococcaceae bacterium]